MKQLATVLVLSLVFYSTTSIPAAFSEDVNQAGHIKLVKYKPLKAPKESGQPIFIGKEPFREKPQELRLLKKAEIERIGAIAAYEEFTGLRFAKYFSVGQRVEIYQEARPIDSYILDAKAIRFLGQGGKELQWNTPVQFRSQITPLFTRAYGTQFTMDNPDDPSGQVVQLRYTLDYRELYREYHPKWPHLLWHHWLQNEIMLIHGMQIPGIDWYYTLNLGYRYSTINQKDTQDTPTYGGYENRHTYIVNLSLAPHPQFEWFGQFEAYKSKRPRSTYVYSPDHWYYRTEFRFKSDDLKTSWIPWFSYSLDLYWPFKNRFEKFEMGAKLGRDFTNKLSASTLVEYVLSLRDEPDNTAPGYIGPNLICDMAAYVGTENRVSYNVWDKFHLQGGVDFAAGTNMSDFDNWGTFLGMEYYNPGVFRANVGWHTNHYYNIDDFLNSLEFRFYAFM